MPDMKRIHLINTTDLEEGGCRAFEFERDGQSIKGFLARHQGRWVAYENRCQHLAIPLDMGDERFFSRDGRHFICQTHAALYEPLTGLCVRGPCAGGRLEALKIEASEGAVWLILEP